ncbi:MAG: hypothetical protein KAX04_03320 [Methanomicrobia archaeon]|nr:hypothetical protein [Methanomicrobia archaeon]
MYSKTDVLIGNFFMVLWISLGTLGCFFLNPNLALIYLLFAIGMVYLVLRKMVCTHCYYYDKWCSMGWGKLSALFFKKEEEGFEGSAGIKVAPATYGLLTLIPLLCLIASLLNSFSYEKIVILILLLVISAYSGTIGRKRACAKCKMKDKCLGSAVK